MRQYNPGNGLTDQEGYGRFYRESGKISLTQRTVKPLD
jgi:hypothetical protein